MSIWWAFSCFCNLSSSASLSFWSLFALISASSFIFLDSCSAATLNFLPVLQLIFQLLFVVLLMPLLLVFLIELDVPYPVFEL